MTGGHQQETVRGETANVNEYQMRPYKRRVQTGKRQRLWEVVGGTDVPVWCPPASHLSPPKEGTRSQSQSARFLWLKPLLIGRHKEGHHWPSGGHIRHACHPRLGLRRSSGFEAECNDSRMNASRNSPKNGGEDKRSRKKSGGMERVQPFGGLRIIDKSQMKVERGEQQDA